MGMKACEPSGCFSKILGSMRLGLALADAERLGCIGSRDDATVLDQGGFGVVRHEKAP